MSNNATEKESKDATLDDTFNLAAKSDFITLNAEVDNNNKLDFKKLVNIPTILNNLETKLDDLDVDKVKTVPTGLKKLSDG